MVVHASDGRKGIHRYLVTIGGKTKGAKQERVGGKKKRNSRCVIRRNQIMRTLPLNQYILNLGDEYFYVVIQNPCIQQKFHETKLSYSCDL